MLALREQVRIFLSLTSIDMRKSIDSLSIEIIDTLKSNPQTGDVYVFRNASCDKVKLLYWDRNGFILHYKRLERHRFRFPKNVSMQQPLTLSHAQLNWLLAGLDFYLMNEFSELNFSDYF